MNEVVITVRGEHEARIAPERGVAHVSVRAEGPDRGPVVEQIATLAAPLGRELTERKDAGSVSEWSSQRVSVWSNRPWNDQGVQLPLVHYASVSFTASFSDFAALSWWVGDIASRDGIQIDTVEWKLTPDSHASAEADAATRAVGVAVARATAYASALGRNAVTPLEVADLELLSRRNAPSGGAMGMDRMMMASHVSAGSPSVSFEPEDIVVSAAVEARFSAS